MYKATSLERKGAPVKNPSFQMAFKDIEVKEDGTVKIKGYASTPDVDRYDDIVKPEAFKSAMDGYMTNPVVLLGHNPDKVLGRVVDYNLDSKGLEVTAVLTNDIENTFKNITDKNLRGFSIGFICKSWGYRDEGSKQIREIKELDLIEISVVSTPANPSSLFSLSKSIRYLMDEEEKKQAEEIEGNEEVKPKEEAKTEDEPATIDPKPTEEEVKPAENPATGDGTAPEGGKTDDVKGDVKPEEWKALTKEEVKSLVDAAVSEVTKTFEAKLAEISKEKEDLVKKVETLEAKNSSLEEDIKRIPVGGGNSTAEVKNFVQVTDSFVRRQHGYNR